MQIHQLTKQKDFTFFEYIPKFSHYVILPIKYGKTCSECDKLNSDSDIGTIYMNKGLVLIKVSMHKFLKNYYIPAIDKIVFNLSHI